MHALLIHGMGRTPLSMWRLGRALRQSGVTPHLFGYSAAFESVARITSRLRQRLERVAGEEYFIVGHSLGGLLARTALAELDPTFRRPRRIIMLGPPNHSPRLARRFAGAIWFRAINGDAGRMLGDPEMDDGLPATTVPCTIVAGTGGPRGRWSPFGDEVNDGLVSVNEARMNQGEEFIELPVRHPFMMNDRRVRALVRERATA